MRRRLLCSIVLVAGLVPAAGCGSSDKQDYADDFKPLNQKLNKLGEDLGAAVRSGSSASPSQLQKRFSGLDGRFERIRAELTALRTPDDLKQESRTLGDALERNREDAEAIARAAKDSDPAALRRAASKLNTDARDLTTAQNRLLKASGLN